MFDPVHTLQEFMIQTKGIIYILGIGYLIGFVAFWRFLHKHEKDDL
jgi:plastocyanin domain-containing protein